MQEQVITTKNVKDAINENVKRLDLFDFSIGQYSTYLYDTNTGAFNTDISEKHISDEVFLHPDMKIGQEYTLIINEYESEEELPKKLLDVKLSSSKDMCEVFADIKLNEDIAYTEEDIFASIVVEINKKKALAGVLINIFDECMFEILTLKVEELMKTMNARILVSKSRYKAVDTQKFEIQRVFLENKKNINSQFIPTQEGKILLRITPYIKGHGGRSCFGRYLYFQDYDQGEIPTIKHNPDTVEVISDSAGKLAYMAKKNGLVEFEDNYLDVKDNIKVSQISQTKTGDIELDNVTVYVNAKDELDDSVEDGTFVESENLNVDTMIGANAKIKSIDVNVKAATHSTSYIEAETAYIKIHKGTLKAKKAKIGTLEHGFVEAGEVEIDIVLGGKVIADSVIIRNIQASNADILAHKSISVDNITGEGNILRIKYGFNTEIISQMEEVKKKVEYMGNDIVKLNSAIEQNKKFFSAHKYKIDAIVKMPKDKLSIAEQKMAQAAITTKNTIVELETKKGILQNQKDLMQKKLTQFTNDIFFTKVVIGKCTPGNVIEFVVYNDKKDQVIRYVTTEHDSDTIFTLSEEHRIEKERR